MHYNKIILYAVIFCVHLLTITELSITVYMSMTENSILNIPGIYILLLSVIAVKYYILEVNKDMAQLTEFGKDIKKRLIDLDHPQLWLIEQVKERTGLYFDDAYLWRILTGQLSTPKIVTAIREILELPENAETETDTSDDAESDT